MKCDIFITFNRSTVNSSTLQYHFSHKFHHSKQKLVQFVLSKRNNYRSLNNEVIEEDL